MDRMTGAEQVAAAERAAMDALFSEQGRQDPQSALRSSAIAGCGYAFVQEVLHDPRFVAPVVPPSTDLMFQVVSRFMARLPPAPHSAVRRHFSGLFTPRRVDRYRERIAARVDALIDALPAEGPVDLVAAFTRPLPFQVISDVLGVPSDRQDWLTQAVDTFGRAVAGQRDHANVELGNATAAEMLSYFEQALTDRAEYPREDVLSSLAAEPTTAEARADLLANCIFYVLAGHVTTTALLSAGVHLLAEHPHQLAQLMAGPEGWPAAVDELLRFVSPTTLTGTTASVDAEVEGHPVSAGQHRILAFAAANRDPEVFTNPDEFDVSRSPNPHLAFSAGAHYCLGAPLARIHAEIALPALFTRLPGLHPVAPPVWRASVPVRQIARLSVEWD
ncbi:cytochrome P450 [Actinophytocola sp.]|uniref:cytochrome P450 n=1 Tax=Actinophytocola sp. TaxID=1872138 RepID=UPI00389A5B3B